MRTPMEDHDLAQLYRRRAEELRLIAETFSHERARSDLLALAEQWEIMAERIRSRIPARAILRSLGELQEKAGD